MRLASTEFFSERSPSRPSRDAIPSGKSGYGKWRRRIGLAASALSAFFLAGCASGLSGSGAHSAIHGAGPEARALQETRQENGNGTILNDGPLESRWARGSCALDGRMLTYSSGEGDGAPRQKGMILDIDVRGAISLMCSGEFTAILTTGSVVVSLGGDAILQGREMLGAIGGRFLPANSYEVSLRRVNSEDGGVAHCALREGFLEIESRGGNAWRLDLADPYSGWNVSPALRTFPSDRAPHVPYPRNGF